MTEVVPAPRDSAFSDRFAELMRNAANEAKPDTDPASEWTADTDELPAVSETTDTESYSIPNSEEEPPMFAQIMAERAGVIETSPAVSNVDQSASRIGKLLRGSADLADTTSEKLADGKEFAKSKLRSFGRAALRAARATRELGAGAKVLAGQAARSGAEQVGAATKRGLEAAGTKVADTYNGAIDKGMASLDKGADYVGDKMADLKENVKEKLVARKNAALARRQARRERWSQRFTSAKETVKSGYDKIETGVEYAGTKLVNAKDKVADKAERARSTGAALRAIGRTAIDARRA